MSPAIRFAEALSLDVTAEGIETRAQADWLAAAGCRYGQGYLFSAPVPKEAIPELFAASAD